MDRISGDFGDSQIDPLSGAAAVKRCSPVLDTAQPFRLMTELVTVVLMHCSRTTSRQRSTSTSLAVEQPTTFSRSTTILLEQWWSESTCAMTCFRRSSTGGYSMAWPFGSAGNDRDADAELAEERLKIWPMWPLNKCHSPNKES